MCAVVYVIGLLSQCMVNFRSPAMPFRYSLSRRLRLPILARDIGYIIDYFDTINLVKAVLWRYIINKEQIYGGHALI